MSEKRFSVRLRSECDGGVYSFFDGDKPLNVDMIVDLLNEQQATNDYLEEANSRLQVQLGKTLRLVDKLKEENEQLKKENEKLGNIHLSIDLTYSYGYGGYLADVRVVDNE